MVVPLPSTLPHFASSASSSGPDEELHVIHLRMFTLPRMSECKQWMKLGKTCQFRGDAVGTVGLNTLDESSVYPFHIRSPYCIFFVHYFSTLMLGQSFTGHRNYKLHWVRCLPGLIWFRLVSTTITNRPQTRKEQQPLSLVLGHPAIKLRQSELFQLNTFLFGAVQVKVPEKIAKKKIVQILETLPKGYLEINNE